MNIYMSVFSFSRYQHKLLAFSKLSDRNIYYFVDYIMVSTLGVKYTDKSTSVVKSVINGFLVPPVIDI